MSHKLLHFSVKELNIYLIQKMIYLGLLLLPSLEPYQMKWKICLKTTMRICWVKMFSCMISNRCISQRLICDGNKDSKKIWINASMTQGVTKRHFSVPRKCFKQFVVKFVMGKTIVGLSQIKAIVYQIPLRVVVVFLIWQSSG